MKNFFSIFLPVLVFFLMPLVAALPGGAGWISHDRALVLVFVMLAFISSIVIFIFFTIVKKSKLRTLLISGLILLWIVFFLLYFITHISFMLDHVNVRRGMILFLFLFFFTLAYYINLSRLQDLITFMSIGVLMGTFVDLWKMDFLKFSESPSKAPVIVSEPVHVFHILFDMFSFVHATRNPDFIKEVKKLSEKHSLTFYNQQFSNAAFTEQSVPDFLRLDRSQEVNFAFLRGDDNVIFKFFLEAGYKVSIHGQGMPYCKRFSALSHTCFMKPHSESYFVEIQQALAMQLAEIHKRIPSIFFGNTVDEIVYLSPENSIQMVDSFIHDHPRDYFNGVSTFSYMHVLMPHIPAVLDENCIPRSDWKKMDLPSAPPIFMPDEQLDRYQAQAFCTLKTLDRILSYLENIGIYDRSIVIIHSDHGRLRDLRTVLNRMSSLTSAEIIESGKIFAWTKTQGQHSSLQIDYPTSNATIGRFLMLQNQTVLPREDELVFRFGLSRHDLVPYFSKDGINWSSSQSR
ncbi:MAG: sulfatase-like hydrolase/transferase [Deltaproteobacteria bacterium]|nr:sulfatase-like hydrolase/transferase [Deltaproteobacteria bacterium]